jgi:hypothetical protein
VPKKNDGQTVHKLTLKGEVPVDGFWSITVYGADGYLHKNDQDSYSINNVTAKEGCRRFSDDPIRRLRRRLPLTVYRHPRLELLGAALSPAQRNPRRNLEVSGSAAAVIYFQEKAIHKEFMKRHEAST